MKDSVCCIFRLAAWLCLVGSGAFAADSSKASRQLYPVGMKGITELFTARMVILSWVEFNSSPQPSEFPSRNTVFGLLYAPVKKVLLDKPFASYLERRVQVKTQIHLEPSGYFIAYSPDNAVWLIRMERNDHFVTIIRLKGAAEAGDPEFSKLYWQELDVPRFQSQSRSLHNLLEKQKAAQTGETTGGKKRRKTP